MQGVLSARLKRKGERARAQEALCALTRCAGATGLVPSARQMDARLIRGVEGIRGATALREFAEQPRHESGRLFQEKSSVRSMREYNQTVEARLFVYSRTA